jgi:hypothetical protein
LRHNPDDEIAYQGIVWYRQKDYDRLLTMFEDAHKLPRTYEDWLKWAKTDEQRVRKSGTWVVRAIIDPDTFPAWCESKKLKMDARGRKSFAAEKAKEAHLSSQ